jgi:threonine aldolase
MIDLRSDTVTKPTADMRVAASIAIVGDDVYEEDPTVKTLEERISHMFHKESALFFPSGTMSNLAALLCWCPNRGSEIIVGDKSHIFLYEQTGASQFGGLSYRTVPNLVDGTMEIDDIRSAIRDDDIHEPVSKLICIENTHNVCGGKVLPLEFMKELKLFAEEHRIPIHMDGARLWNSCQALEKKPHELSKHVDSLTVCLSKGLGCPIGSLLVGSAEFILKARRIRKALGGGMRQSGLLAATGIVALNDFERGILKYDHRRTKLLANSIKLLPAFRLHTGVETNILFIDIVIYNHAWEKSKVSSHVVSMLKSRGILASAWSPLLLRMVVHRDIDDNNIYHVIQIMQEISGILTGY